MVGIFDKIKKFGNNLWSGVKDYGLPMLQTVAPLFGDKGQRVNDILTTGVGAVDSIGSSLNQLARRNPPHAQPPKITSGVRKLPSAAMGQR
jgi:hypothetical protein